MNTVDKDEAAKRARQKANKDVALMYKKTNTPDAHRAWSRIFWREYNAYVSPLPSDGEMRNELEE